MPHPAARGSTASRVPDDARRAESVTRLLRIIDDLRTHCLWTRNLTHAALVEYLIEESYELVEAIEDDHGPEEVRGEIADVLWQLVLHSAIAEEAGSFDFADVADHLAEKMIRRNKHVFAPDGSLLGDYPSTEAEIIASWDEAKRAERAAAADPAAGRSAGTVAFAAPERHLPALARAQKTLGRAERAGAGAVVERLRDPAGQRTVATEEELGDELLRIVAAARRDGWDAERALRGAVARFTEDVTRALG
ncbi:MazG nucleotide pyrophosphohydrolase domain-containing protein [Zhihengliuella flava]|uniref:XTP/dITP diphosphohydrolase n=1 Tax=Zhihengliuella flava TaxID=1285193 RepID=A0A931D7U0_9MICC|nr:MazG nucleotide pyrophosphohydrolase domain-containing protein [Zhihengliuella flava]MBG6084007.1 XTP/dITP diphosphohydrolase [Zhihengliuella flava]